jgi:two-component system LytT family response regulator
MTNEINCIIVDDELKSREALSKLIAKYCPEIKILAKAENVETAKDLILKHQPDLVFLDVEMPKKSGFELLNEFKTINFDVIFVTAHETFAVKAFRYSAVDYLTKPVDFRELIEAVNKFKQKQKVELKQQRFEMLLENISNNAKEFNRIAIPNLQGYQLVSTTDIIYAEGDGNYTNIYLLNGEKILSSRTLKYFDGLLPTATFFRIHKSFLININLIDSYNRIDGNFVVMKNKNQLDVSERNKREFLEKITKNQ